MKLNERQLNQRLSEQAYDSSVHVVHDPGQDFTVSYIITDVDDNRVWVRAAAAKRNPKDNFCRRIGRLISGGRILSGKGEGMGIPVSLPRTSEDWRFLDSTVTTLMGMGVS